MAHHRDELALELAEPLEAGEVGGGRLLRVVLGGDVLEHREVVLELAAAASHRGHAPVQPHLAAVRAPDGAVAFDVVGSAHVERFELLEHPQRLFGRQVLGHERADHDLLRRVQERAHTWVGVDHAVVRADSSHAQRRVKDHLVEQVRPLFEPQLGPVADCKQGEGVTVQEHHAGHQQDAQPAGNRGQELVETEATRGEGERNYCRSEQRQPRHGHLPQVGGSLLLGPIRERSGPERREGDQEVADHPAGVGHVARRGVDAGRGEVCERAVGHGGRGEAGEQQGHRAALLRCGPAHGQQKRGDVGAGDQQQERD